MLPSLRIRGPIIPRITSSDFEAIPLGENITFMHLRYSFRYSALGYFFMKIFGGTKIGFSIIGTDIDGNPVYAEGLRGLVERDVVCYCLATLAYFDTLETPYDQRFGKRIRQWYDLTVPFKKQFYDMTKEEYLTYKGKDWESQQRFQADLNK